MYALDDCLHAYHMPCTCTLMHARVRRYALWVHSNVLSTYVRTSMHARGSTKLRSVARHSRGNEEAIQATPSATLCPHSTGGLKTWRRAKSSVTSGPPLVLLHLPDPHSPVVRRGEQVTVDGFQRGDAATVAK